MSTRVLLAFLHDAMAVAVAWLLAFLFRFNFDIPEYYQGVLWQTLWWVIPLQAAILWLFGLYRGIWRYASLADIQRILLAVMTASAAVTAILFMLRIGVPRAVIVLDPILLAGTMAGSRLAFRMWKEWRAAGPLATKRRPVLVLGAGETGAVLITELARGREWRVVGLLDDDTRKFRRQIHGVSILGPLDALPTWRDALGVEHAIIAMPRESHNVRRRAVELCHAAGVQPMTVPSYDDLVSGKVTVSQIRHVELDDLLGRDPVKLDTAGMDEWIGGRTILVTGAGGSIGSELCRQVLRFRPRVLILLELSEHALYQIEQELGATAADTEFVWAIGDIRNRARVEQIIAAYRPSVVFHAAAYKHVPLMEDDNAWEAMINNVTGTRIVAECAQRHGVEKFVLISTDKAVNPTNVMGASKRLAEKVCQALQRAEGTRFVIVRFGNVLGSTGSVIPKFRAQIAAGGPVTVTHPDIQRYFMSIPEAAQLVLQAGLMGRGGEVFVLDMGAPVKIVDLARDLIRLSGFDEDEIGIEYTGLRPGEKLYEELLATNENTLPTPHPKLRIAKVQAEDRVWLAGLERWLESKCPRQAVDIKRRLVHWVPEYTPHGLPANRDGASA